MAELPFTDTHVHFYDLEDARLRYEWLQPTATDPDLTSYQAIKALRYWADDFLAETRFHNVTKVIHVQAAIGIDDPVAETEWLQAFADRLGGPHGIVGYADLTAPDVGELLERHAQFPNFRGIRDLREDDYFANPEWQRGYAQLERFGLVSSQPAEVEMMPDALEVAQRFPAITLCLEHTGYPRARDDGAFERWRAAIGAVASAPNTAIKISGLGMFDSEWTVESIRPYVLGCVEAFGVERCMFGTNWPVDRLFSSYGDVLDAYAELVADFTDAEQRALFGENANRIFRLGPRPNVPRCRL
jgi:predicted TIM-barrel fold metal-dependent hydrolase